MVLCRFTRGTQGFNARSFADKPCIAHSHYGMRAVTADFAAAAACPLGPLGPSGPSCKVVRDKTCASALIVHRVSGLVCLQGLIASPCTAVSPQGKTALSRCRRSAPVAPGGGEGPVARRAGWAQKMWQNVSKISPLFCGKIFEIFCHGLPAGGTTIARHCDFLSPLDPFLGSLA